MHHHQNMNWMIWVLFVGLVWIHQGKSCACSKDDSCSKIRNCLEKHTSCDVPDNINEVIDTPENQGGGHTCIQDDYCQKLRRCLEQKSCNTRYDINKVFKAIKDWNKNLGKSCTCIHDKSLKNLKECFIKGNTSFVVPDNFNGVITTSKQWNCTKDGCIVFLQKVKNTSLQDLNKKWPQIEEKDSVSLVYISKWHIKKHVNMSVVRGRNCRATEADLNGTGCVNDSNTGCQFTRLDTEAICRESTYDENFCNEKASQVKDRYIINITGTNINCLNCNNPVKKPEKTLNLDDLKSLNISSDFEKGKELDASKAAELMSQISNVANAINTSSAELTLGEGITGVLVRKTEPEDIEEVSFAYGSPEESISIVENRDSLTPFSRSVTVPKEAFENSVKSNISIPFAAVFRFTNMTKDETNRSVLGNEVLAIEMGATIKNLTDNVCIKFQKVKYEGTPSCQSWNGEGSRPNWTDDGCQMIEDGENITCQCSHLTFFAILMAPPNQTISSSDMKNLTTITQVGCGLSMFFLAIILFRHFLLRKTKASISTRFLIHLVSAMFLLNLTFLINNFVANLKNSVGCKIMAVLMHYFMLATFTWFAVQAFHLCLQLYTGGKVVIRHYILKVSISSWALPSLVGIILLIKEKYGEQVIYTNDNKANVSMCWITDSDVHYVVNIGYYALVFLFTFATFIIILSWLFCLKRTGAGNANTSTSGISIIAIMGLCCMLGITWGFAFLAHGAFRMPAYYIFTILNSFQGFFLFIHHYKTYNAEEINSVHKTFNTTTTTITTTSNSTLKPNPDSSQNPYSNFMGKK